MTYSKYKDSFKKNATTTITKYLFYSGCANVFEILVRYSKNSSEIMRILQSIIRINL